jgi:hypothetical protein
MAEKITDIFPRVYKELEKFAGKSKRFKIGITCHYEFVSTEPEYTYKERFHSSNDKDFTEELVRMLITHSKTEFPEKCMNKENIRINDLEEEITGKYTIYIVWRI